MCATFLTVIFFCATFQFSFWATSILRHKPNPTQRNKNGRNLTSNNYLAELILAGTGLPNRTSINLYWTNRACVHLNSIKAINKQVCIGSKVIFITAWLESLQVDKQQNLNHT